MRLGYVCQYFTTEFRGPVSNLLHKLSESIDVVCYSSVGRHMQYYSGGRHAELTERLNEHFYLKRYEYRLKLGGVLFPRNLGRLISSDKPDILQSEEYYQPATHTVYKYSVRNNRPFIVNHRGSDRRNRTLRERLFFPPVNAFSKKVVMASGKVVCLTEKGRRLFLEVFPFKEDDTVVIPNSIDPGLFEGADGSRFRREYSIPEGKPLVVCVARIHPQKRVDLLVEAFSRVKDEVRDAVLAVVGPWTEAEKRRVDSIISKTGVEDVVFTGPVPNEDVKHAYAAADVVALASEYEPFGYCLLEAMCLGRPVVAFDVGGVSEIVEQGVSGFHVPFGDTNVFAGKILQLLEDGKTAARMGVEGRNLVDVKFSLQGNSRKLIEVYRELTS
jgi:glycosyltransferase involved in cell wall biosynthesis